MNKVIYKEVKKSCHISPLKTHRDSNKGKRNGFQCPSGPLSKAVESGSPDPGWFGKVRLTPSQEEGHLSLRKLPLLLEFPCLEQHQLRASQIHPCFKVSSNHTREALGESETETAMSTAHFHSWGWCPEASWAGTEPRCHPGMLGPRRASRTLSLSFLPVA